MKYMFLNVEVDIMRINIENYVGPMTSHPEAVGSGSLDEICNDVLAV